MCEKDWNFSAKVSRPPTRKRTCCCKGGCGFSTTCISIVSTPPSIWNGELDRRGNTKMPRTDLTWDTMDRLTAPTPQEAANKGRRQAAVRLLRAAMERELTPRQRQCVELCVLRGLSQVEAGQMLGLNKSTVCRHLQKAKRVLRRAASYAGMSKGL